MGHFYGPSIPTNTTDELTSISTRCCVILLSSSSSAWLSSPIWSPYKEPNIVKLKNTPVLVGVMKSMLPAKVVIATINVMNLMTAAMMSTRNVEMKDTPVLVDVMKSMLPAKFVIATINVLHLMTAAMMSTRNVSEESGRPKKDVEDICYKINNCMLYLNN